MIVADTNVVTYLLLGGEKTPGARLAFRRDPVWAAPILWRSEFRNVLAAFLRRRTLRLSDALEVMQEAETLLRGAGCSAYDCEFVALAQQLDVPL